VIGRWTHLTWVYVGILLLRIVVLVVSIWQVRRGVPLLLQDQGLCALAGVTLGLLWLHRAWARVPKAHRRAYDGQRIEPDDAISKLFIPVYGVYWAFVANTGLSGAVERHLQRNHARSVSVPSTLAFMACLVQLVPVLNLVVSPFLWGLFMARVDAAQAEAERLDAEPVAPEPIGWLGVLGILAGSILALWGTLTVTALALWQFLNPATP